MVRPCGDTAVLLDCDSLNEARQWFAALDDDTQAVLGARTVLLRGNPARLRTLIASTSPAPLPTLAEAPQIEVPVSYDGPDLAEVADLTDMTEDEVVEAHTGTPWTVAFGGFAPGFFYLLGGDPRLRVPRRDSPRQVVPAGSVGLAGEFSGVYPRGSPGGWQLIGHTSLAMWDSGRTEPALLHPGMTVRFVVER